ncbi:MAG: serine acetyltransferase [Firmicutes bacterium]|nr:serine acetyltransferase [Clostridiales bacterium]MBQ9973114.1 serine acetyltransferase [Bacillota bacterium]
MANDFKGNLPEYIEALTKSYHENPISEKASLNLPDKEEIIEIIDDVLMLLYPQYYGNKKMDEATEKYIIGNLMQIVYQKLKRQIKLAFLYEYDRKNVSIMHDAEEKAEAVCMYFFEQLPEIYRLLTLDVQAAFDGDPAAKTKDQIVFSYPGLLAISIHRIAHVFYQQKVPMISRIMSEHAHGKTGIDIHPGATIGEYFFIDHGTGVVIGETTEIGNNVKIYQGVTLGALSTRNANALRNSKRHPTIKDNVTIYAGATVLGGETVIGENTTISGGAFITEPIPANCLVNTERNKLKYVKR